MTSTAASVTLASGLRLSVMRLARRLRAERAATDLTLSQFAALATVDRHGPLSPGELAAHERVQPPSMTRMLARLEAAGLVVRSDHATDRRQVVVSLTPHGAELLREDRARRDAWLAQRLAELAPEDLETLRRAAVVLDGLASQ